MSTINNVTTTAAQAQTSNTSKPKQKDKEHKKVEATKSDEYAGSSHARKTGNYNKNGVKVDHDMLSAAKAEMKNNAGAFKAMVEGAKKNNTHSLDSKDSNYWGKWVHSQLGKQYSVSEAKSLVADDGYWGVEQTSQRIVDFAKGLAGGDMSQYDKLLDAIEKGFGSAKASWGGKMPDITGKTYYAVMEKMQAWKEEGADKSTETADAAITTAINTTTINTTATNVDVQVPSAQTIVTQPANDDKPQVESAEFLNYVTKYMAKFDNSDEILKGIQSTMFLHQNKDTLTTFQERAVMRESALKLAEHIASNYMPTEQGAHYLSEMKRLNKEAELEEQGYERIYDYSNPSGSKYGTYTYGRPTDNAYNQYDLFLKSKMNDEEKEKYNYYNSQSPRNRDRGYEDFYVSMVEKYILPTDLPKQQANLTAGKKMTFFTEEEKAFDNNARIVASTIDIFKTHDTVSETLSKKNMKDLLQMFSQSDGQSFTDILFNFTEKTMASFYRK